MREVRPKDVWRWQAGQRPSPARDELANEEPLEIRVGGQPVSVTMRTPGQDAELAVGFLLSEALIHTGSDVAACKPVRPEGTAPSARKAVRLEGAAPSAPGVVESGESCNVIDVTLAPGLRIDLQRLTRHVFASSSCGLCGKATIDAVHQQFPPVRSDITVGIATLLALAPRARVGQTTFERTGGLHAAAVFDPSGELVVLREDVGRHNAVDKVLGYGLLNGLFPFDRHILLVSGRASFEIMQKALAGRLPIVAAVSAPSSLAVEFAESSGQTLIGFLRGERMNIYAGRQRIVFA